MPKKVPYLQEEQIERDAAALLAEYEPKSEDEPDHDCLLRLTGVPSNFRQPGNDDLRRTPSALS